MSWSGSYDPHQHENGLGAELDRLESQVEISWREESRLLERIGLRDGMSVLEVGSGPGSVTRRLLTLLPTSQITAIEVRPDLLEVSRERLSGAGRRLDLIRSTVFETGFATDTFDFAIARLVFQHLDGPVEAANELLRVLKPGGKLVIIDVDAALWGTVEPSFPGLDRIYEKAGVLQAQRGGNRLIGRRLWRVLDAAGYESPHLEVFAYHSDQLGVEAFKPLMDPNYLLPAASAGVLSPAELAEAQLRYSQFLDWPDAYVLMLGFMAHGAKPRQ